MVRCPWLWARRLCLKLLNTSDLLRCPPLCLFGHLRWLCHVQHSTATGRSWTAASTDGSKDTVRKSPSRPPPLGAERREREARTTPATSCQWPWNTQQNTGYARNTSASGPETHSKILVMHATPLPVALKHTARYWWCMEHLHQWPWNTQQDTGYVHNTSANGPETQTKISVTYVTPLHGILYYTTTWQGTLKYKFRNTPV